MKPLPYNKQFLAVIVDVSCASSEALLRDETQRNSWLLPIHTIGDSFHPNYPSIGTAIVSTSPSIENYNNHVIKRTRVMAMQSLWYAIVIALPKDQFDYAPLGIGRGKASDSFNVAVGCESASGIISLRTIGDVNSLFQNLRQLRTKDPRPSYDSPLSSRWKLLHFEPVSQP